MSQGSGFIAAAAAALVVSVGAAGFLAARRSHSTEAVPFSPVASDSAAAPQASPLTPPVVQSPVAESLRTSSRLAPKNAPEVNGWPVKDTNAKTGSHAARSCARIQTGPARSFTAVVGTGRRSATTFRRQ